MSVVPERLSPVEGGTTYLLAYSIAKRYCNKSAMQTNISLNIPETTCHAKEHSQIWMG